MAVAHDLAEELAELALGWVAGGYLYLRADWDEKVVREAFEVAGREVPAGVYRGPRVSSKRPSSTFRCKPGAATDQGAHYLGYEGPITL